MNDIAIKVENLGKQYKIGSQKAAYRTLRESLVETAQAPFRRVADLLRGESYGAADLDQTIWALKDVNFEVQQGEVVGIIGRNGAGKSTLLKVLSRITDPTEGRALVRGRVGSLLEVGTGFHPELTGRENIYLNGSILGMRRNEIESSFNEIVEFSGVEKFIDTPVKHYSSGMYVRLAFSVAAHLEPEILFVDEVLSVGDAEFQKKCLGKMGDEARSGRTVLFVSHNMAAINNLCQTTVVLENGQVVFRGETNEAVRFYLGRLNEKAFNGGKDSLATFNDDKSKPIQFRKIFMEDSENQIKTTFEYHEMPNVRLVIELKEPNQGYITVIYIKDTLGNLVFLSHDNDLEKSPIAKLDSGVYEYRVKLPHCLLKPGQYYLSAKLKQQFLNDKRVYDNPDPAMTFDVIDTKAKRGSSRIYSTEAIVAPEILWVIEPALKGNSE